jgi:type IIS restriction enzyme protein
LQELFEINSSKKIYHANDLQIFNEEVKKSYPYVVRMTQNNGIRGYIVEDCEFLNPANTLSFAQDTFSVFYQEKPFYTGNKVKILIPKFQQWNKKIGLSFSVIFQKVLEKFTWGTGSTVETIAKTKISLPVKKDREIDFAFMEDFISQLEACRLSQLEAYLLVTGLKNYTLTPAEEQALTDFQNGKVKWGEFNLENLYGKSTRGKRLKSADRINGDLPFVTAGEAETGVSAFIGNDVEIFAANTTTIDMFGSAKYRNYEYGGDDHIAVVHTEKINKYAAIFVTTAIHKSSYTGKFSYSRNFYAKDADELNIYLPTTNNIPDYSMMEILISAVQKLVIKDVVEYADRKIEATKKIINK